MAHKVPASFFRSDSVVFAGYSRERNAAFCSSVRKAFESAGATVYPVNPNPGDYDVKVFPRVSDVPGSPELAYVLTRSERTAALLDELAAKGVKRVLFNSKMSADRSTLERCSRLGMQSAVACPMMALGGGFHRFHGFLSGVQRLAPSVKGEAL